MCANAVVFVLNICLSASKVRANLQTKRDDTVNS